MDEVIAHLMDMSVPSLFLSSARHFFAALLIFYLMHKLLPNRLNIYSITAIALVFMLWNNLKSNDLFGSGYHIFMNVFINAWTWLILLFLFKGKLWRRYIVWWYFELVKLMCEALANVPVLLFIKRNDLPGEWNHMIELRESETALTLLFLLTLIALFVLFGYLSLTIWRRILMKRFHAFYLVLIALPMGQRYALARVVRPNMGDQFFMVLVNFVDSANMAYDILSIFGIFASLAVTVAILYYILSHDKRTAVEAQLSEAKHQMELEQTRYIEMEQRNEELAKIRHDFNNQLASIIQLVRVGEDNTARSIISALSNEIIQG